MVSNEYISMQDSVESTGMLGHKLCQKLVKLEFLYFWSFCLWQRGQDGTDKKLFWISTFMNKY